MKKTTSIAVCIVLATAMTSCVSMSKMEELQSRYDRTSKQYALTKQELDEMKEENNTLSRQNQSLIRDIESLTADKNNAETTIDSLQRSLEHLQQHYDTTMENYMQQVAGKNRDLNRAQNLLTARTKELNEKAAALSSKEQQLAQQQQDFQQQKDLLLSKQQELEEQEAAARAQLQAKERELEAVRSSVAKALTGFSDKGLNVEVKEGKVYVSMENKLLFPSASWQVSKDGVEAIKQLAKVLEADSTLNILVEGHTDNDPYHGSSAVKDNWDLSVIRATTIVKLLLQHGKGINPARVEACGHGEFAPKVPNTSTSNKAINRRTEIIITPNLDLLLKEIQ